MSIITDILKEIPLSAVLRERLTEAEAKMAALDKENAILKTVNHNLQVDVKRAHEEIDRLKGDVDRLQKPAAGPAFGEPPRRHFTREQQEGL